MELRITLVDRRIQPGGEIRGTLHWSSDQDLKAIKLRLSWSTEGKGSGDSGTAHQDTLDNPPRRGSQDFVLYAPEAPYSFSGKVVSLIWSVGARAEPSGETVWEAVTISPTGEEIVLHKNAPSR